MRNNILNRVLALLISALLFSGCSKTDASGSAGESSYEAVSADISEFVESNGESDSGEYFYKVSCETVSYELPELDDEWIKEDEPEYATGHYSSEDRVREKNGFFFIRESTQIVNGEIYIIDLICGENQSSFLAQSGAREYPKSPWRVQYGTLITVIHKDGTGESYCLDNIKLDDRYYFIRSILGTDDNGSIYLYLSHYYYGNGYEPDYCLGTYDEVNGFRMLGELPDPCRNKKGCYIGGKLYFSDFSRPERNSEYDSHVIVNTSKTVYIVDINNLTDYSFITLEHYVKGFNVKDNETGFVFGLNDSDSFILRSLQDDKRTKEADLSELIDPATNVNLYAAVSDDENVLYVTDGSLLWTVAGGKKAVTRLEGDYILADSVYSMTVTDDGFKLFAGYDGEDYIYTAKLMKGKKTEKEVIRYAVAYKNPVMEEFIALYNRSNPDYEVVLEDADNISVDDFAQDISVQTAAGNGPELIDDLLIAPLNPCRNGTYAVLDDLVLQTDNPDIIPSVMECGKIDGHQYGIPWTATLFYCVAPQKLLKNKTSWNLEECIGAVEESDYTYFGINSNYMMEPSKIIMYLGLYDTENTDLIDWKNGKSNLEGEGFVKLIQFAKEYGSDEVFMNYQNDDAEYAKVAGTACDYNDMLGTLNFDYYQVLSKKDDGVWIGFPGKNGSSHYIYTACAYVNEGSKNKDGAKDFLAYLISKEGQDNYIRISLKYTGYQTLSVSMKGLGKYAESYNKRLEGIDKKEIITREGRILIEPMSDEMIDHYKDMLLDARPIRKELVPIKAIVDEELGAFLAGQKTAEETAKIIDSRVQLYLDENR